MSDTSNDEFKHKAGNGNLFVNQYKEKANQPDYRGNCTCPQGVSYELAGWKKSTQSGDPYLSISMSVKQEKKNDETAPAQTPVTANAQTDDLPF